jgi:hypothetical protein
MFGERINLKYICIFLWNKVCSLEKYKYTEVHNIRNESWPASLFPSSLSSHCWLLCSLPELHLTFRIEACICTFLEKVEKSKVRVIKIQVVILPLSLVFCENLKSYLTVTVHSNLPFYKRKSHGNIHLIVLWWGVTGWCRQRCQCCAQTLHVTRPQEHSNNTQLL